MQNKRKKIISLILCTSIVLAGCSNTAPEATTTDTTTSTTEPEVDLFAEEYKTVVEKIKEMNDSSEYLIGAIDDMWEEFGPEDVMSAINTVISCTSEQSIKNASVPVRWWIARAVYPEAIDGGDIKAGKEGQVYEKVKKFNDSIGIISDNKDEVDALIKEMRSNYTDRSGEIDKLHEYYVESSLMAELALEPDGSLLNYRSSFNEMKENISRAEKYADIY